MSIKNKKTTWPDLVNWSKLSEEITGDRYRIRRDYNGKKYKKEYNQIKELIDNWLNKREEAEGQADLQNGEQPEGKREEIKRPDI